MRSQRDDRVQRISLESLECLDMRDKVHVLRTRKMFGVVTSE